VLGVNLDAKPAEARRFLAEVPARFALAFDEKGATPRLFGVKGMPTSVLIDREGRIAAVHAGFQPSQTSPLEKEIALLLEAQ
jgi:peroxiredoxin